MTEKFAMNSWISLLAVESSEILMGIRFRKFEIRAKR